MGALAPTSGAAAVMDRMYRRQRHIYDATRKFYLLGRDELIAGLDPPPAGSVLEIGCGTGRNLVRAARIWPSIHGYGVDVSAEMLASARRSAARAGLGSRIALAQADATRLDARAIFGVEKFDRIFVSYALSMIPRWREVVTGGCDHLAPGGALHVVDFGDQIGLPAWFQAALARWLALFSVHPVRSLEGDLRQIAAARGLACRFDSRFRGYAFLARLEAGASSR